MITHSASGSSLRVNSVGSPRNEDFTLALPATPFTATTNGLALSHWSASVSMPAFFLSASGSVYGCAVRKFMASAGVVRSPLAVMNRTYGGTRAFLEPVDVAGIQAIYGPRAPDGLQATGTATSFGTASDLTFLLAGSGAGQEQATLGGLSLCRI